MRDFKKAGEGFQGKGHLGRHSNKTVRDPGLDPGRLRETGKLRSTFMRQLVKLKYGLQMRKEEYTDFKCLDLD